MEILSHSLFKQTGPGQVSFRVPQGGAVTLGLVHVLESGLFPVWSLIGARQCWTLSNCAAGCNWLVAYLAALTANRVVSRIHRPVFVLAFYSPFIHHRQMDWLTRQPVQTQSLVLITLPFLLPNFIHPLCPWNTAANEERIRILICTLILGE